MNRAEELRAKLGAIQRQQEPAAEGQPVQRRKGSTERVKAVRRSVDLSPNQHRKLTEWCNDAADQLGVSRVTGADAIRTLVAQLLTDETLARKIRANLADNINP